MDALMIRIANDLNDKLAQLNRIATPQIAAKIDDQMKQNTATGKAFGNDRYDNVYQGTGVPLKKGKSQNSGYARKRELAGVPTSPVTLRFKSNRIENTKLKQRERVQRLASQTARQERYSNITTMVSITNVLATVHARSFQRPMQVCLPTYEILHDK
jgi:hypothetical protein